MKIPFGRVIIYSKRECDIFKGISQNLGNKSRGYFKGQYQTTCMSQKDPSGRKKKLGKYHRTVEPLHSHNFLVVTRNSEK